MVSLYSSKPGIMRIMLGFVLCRREELARRSLLTLYTVCFGAVWKGVWLCFLFLADFPPPALIILSCEENCAFAWDASK